MRILCLLLLLGALAAVVVLRNDLAKARLDHAELREVNLEVRELVEKNAELVPVDFDPDELERLREANRDIHKLRNEIRQIREKKAELPQLQTVNQSLQAELERRKNQPGSAAMAGRPGERAPLVSEVLLDAGQATPEAAIQTMIWAMSQGNFERAAQVIPSLRKNLQDVPPDQLKTMAPSGFAWGERKDISETEVVIKVLLFPPGSNAFDPDETMLVPFTLKQTGTQWQVFESFKE
jgi:hypothetical protein